MAKLKAENVAVEYLIKRTGQRILAVEGASFAIQEGQFVTMVGPSGCGKTTPGRHSDPANESRGR